MNSTKYIIGFFVLSYIGLYLVGMMGASTSILVSIITLILGGLQLSVEKGKNYIQKLNNELDQMGKYSFKKRYLDGRNLIAVDDENNTLAIFNEQREIITLPFKQVLDYEVLKDDETITKKSTGSAVGRAVVGGILTGGIGAIIGGVTGKSKQKTKVMKLELKIILDSIDRPSYIVTFFDSPMGADPLLLEDVAKTLDEWANIMNVIIKRNNRK